MRCLHTDPDSVFQVLWWDIRRLSEPTERLVLDPGREGNLDRALGGVSLEFESTMVRVCWSPLSVSPRRRTLSKQPTHLSAAILLW